MKTILTTLLVGLSYISLSQKTITFDLHKEVKDKNIQVINREMTLINEPSYQGIKLNRAYGEGLVWLKGFEFSNGTIELDVRGEDLKQHSFVGIAFHAKNDSTYDAVYLRPFHFKAQDEESKKKAIQYISLPIFTWRKLRAESPGKYENSIDAMPDPNSWVKMRIVVKDETISVYINNIKEPSLVVKKVTSLHTGSIGFYVADTSGGDFANIKITKD